MISIERTLPVNPPGSSLIVSRADVWRGLVLKANNALPFVPAMTHCEVIERKDDLTFIREIEFRGDRMSELVQLQPERSVTFVRLAGPVLGTIRNFIDEDASGELHLRFAFELELQGVLPGGDAEKDYAARMESAYLGAVDATLNAIRKLHEETARAPRPELDEATRERIACQLIGRFKGDIMTPDHPAYDERRAVWNAMVDKRPGLILRCTCTEDVVAAVGAAREHGLRPSIRCGGHNVAGKALADGGLTIDLGGMRKVTVDAPRKLVHVEGGCLLGDVDAATAQHGLIVPAGVMSETGVGGLALGGGIGWFARKHGLTCDQFVELEIVLASGEVLHVSEGSHPELFWALKGGGGNFGVVTRFTFKAYEFGPMMRIGASLHKPEDAAEALRAYAEIAPNLPRHVGWHGALKDAIPALPFVPKEMVGKRLLMFITMWLGDAEDPKGIDMVKQLNAVGKPCLQAMTVMPFAAGVQRVIDEEFENGHRYYTKEAHVSELSTEAIDRLVAFWKDMPMQGEIELIALGGAIRDVSEHATAFSNREYQTWLNFAMRWDDPAHDDDFMERTRSIVRDLGPWVGKGIYVNMLNVDEADRVVEAYGGPEKYAKLGRIKARYDPDNLFCINANITPR